MELMALAKERQRVHPIRVLLALRPRMLRHLLRDVFTRTADFKVVGEVEDLEGLTDVVDLTAPGLVLVSVAESRAAEELCHCLLSHHPDLLVINLTTDSRHGYVSRVSIEKRRLEEVSLESLMAAVRGDGGFWDNAAL